MDAALATILLVLLISLVKGQIIQEVLQPDYEYHSGQFLDDDDSMLKDYIPIQTPQERRFLEGLIIEAGRHKLFPEFYTENEDQNKEESKLKFYEIKGQPEVEESYMNQKSRRANCPEHCSVYKPLCGSDGKVYESECHMKKENCGSPGVTVGPWKKCRGRHYLCPSRCLDLNDPVCGSDGKIYHNICVMRKRNCGKLLEVLPVRKCYENFRKSKEDEECPEDCQEIYKPVCGSDGVIYYNDCFMKKRTCKLGIVEVDMEGCAHMPKCPEVCVPIYDPVCGSDGRLYINHCRMLQQNCGREIKVVARTLCAFEEKGKPSANRRI